MFFMDNIKVAIVGWGNVGRGVLSAIEKSPDMTAIGIISRRPEQVRKEVPNLLRVFDYDSSVFVDNADVAMLCGGSKNDLPKQGPEFAGVFNTVDSFDTHANIPEYFAKMDEIARANNRVAIISAGWDPGTFSLERVLGDAFIQGSKRYTFWGPGVSQGHSDAIRQVPGVADAIQYTMPYPAALDKVRAGGNPELSTREKHWRQCFVALKPDADSAAVIKAIKIMPNYFADYDTTVTFETPEKIAERKKEMPHGGFVMTSGQTGDGNKALIEYNNQWASNPEATGNILVACARANYRLQDGGRWGAFTMLDIPAAYLSPRSREELLKDFM